MSLIPNPNINGLTNPLTQNLQANNFEIQAASKVTGTTVETDNIRLVPGSGSTYIDVEDTVRIAGLKALEFSTKPAVGGNIRADAAAGGLHISGLVADVKADVLGYDTVTGQIVVQPAGGSGTLNSVQPGTNISVDNTNPFDPVVSVDIQQDLNMHTFSITNAGNITAASTISGGAAIITTNCTAASVTASTGTLQATVGDVVAVAGNVTAQAGNISATLGDVTAGGNISTSTGTVSGSTVTAVAGGLKSYSGLDLNPSGVPGAESSISGANTVSAVGNITTTLGDISTTSGDIGTGSGNIGTLTGDIGAPAGTVSGNMLSAGVGGIECNGTLNLDPTGLLPNNIAGVDGFDAAGLVKGLNLVAYDVGQPYGSSSITLKTDDPLFAGEAGTVSSITFPDSVAKNAVIYARGPISIVDPPYGDPTYTAKLIINGVPQISGADWSTAPATQNVDMATFSITNANDIGCTTVSATGDIDTTTGDITATAGDIIATAGNITATAGDLNATAGTMNSLNAVVSNDLTLGANALDVETLITFKPNATLYVAKNGNDTTGTGSILQPYLTIQKAYDVAKLTSSSANIFAINIAAGHYTENLNITGRTYCWFVGAVPQGTLGGVGETTEIVGTITVNANVPGGDDLYNKVTGFVNLQISGSITVSSSNESTLVVQNCKFFSTDRAIYVNPSATDYRTYLQSCAIAHQSAGAGTNPLIEVTQGWLYANTGTWNAKNNSPILRISGTGSALAVSGLTLESSNNSATLANLVEITTTSTTTNTFGQCALIATDTTAKASTRAIYINSATPPAVNLLQDYFGIGGTSAATNVIGYAGTAPTLQLGSCAAQFGTAAAIQSGITAVGTLGVGTQSFGAISCSSITNTGNYTTGTGNITSTSGTISGGTVKSTGTLQMAANAITNASNNTTISGVNSIAMGGTNPTITSVNNITITNTNSTVPLTITNVNAGGANDNPHLALNVAVANPAIPTEMQFNNGITSAIGNQGTDPRGSIILFTNAKDVMRVQSALLRVQMNYSPYAPFYAASGVNGLFTPGTAGAWVSGVPKLLGTQTVTLSASNFPIIPGGFGTPYYLGVNGYLNTAILNAAHDFTFYVQYSRTRSGVVTGPYTLYGATYPITSQAGGAFYTPLNGVTYNESVVAERVTFTHNDILTLTLYGLYSGGSPPNLVTPPIGIAAVFSPFL